MRFTYRLALVISPETGEADMILRPEIAIRLIGPAGAFRYQGLLDTGADRTIVPKTIAAHLGIELREGCGTPATGFGGHQLTSRHGDVEIVLESDGESCRWAITADFIEVEAGAAETILLGYAGFLEFFRATFDAEHGVIDLEPNSLHPSNL